MSGAQQAGTAEDEAAVRRVIVEMTDGFNNHDGRAAARMYTPDARFVSVRGDMMNGQAGIEEVAIGNINEQGEERHAANNGCHGSIHSARCGARECNQ
jgi:ketosteroid isomerase-like protein